MQPIRFCAHPGCFEVAIKTKRTDDLCRPHHREVLAKVEDLVRCEVIAARGSRGESAGVSDCLTNETVRFGGVVTLDPLETNIAALVYGGAVKVLPGTEAVKAKA